MDLYLLGWLLCGVAALRLLALLYGTLSSPLRKVRGPFLARFTNGWYFWRVYCGQFNHDNIDLHSRYGRQPRNSPHPVPTID